MSQLSALSPEPGQTGTNQSYVASSLTWMHWNKPKGHSVYSSKRLAYKSQTIGNKPALTFLLHYTENGFKGFGVQPKTSTVGLGHWFQFSFYQPLPFYLELYLFHCQLNNDTIDSVLWIVHFIFFQHSFFWKWNCVSVSTFEFDSQITFTWILIQIANRNVPT